MPGMGPRREGKAGAVMLKQAAYLLSAATSGFLLYAIASNSIWPVFIALILGAVLGIFIATACELSQISFYVSWLILISIIITSINCLG
jgi:hypothetical protein